jgi:GT2 family glycosyltransferase
MPKYDIIVTVFNRLEYTKRTIASLIDSGAVAGAERFIIVDNASAEPNMAAFLEDMKNQYGAFILQRPHNKGWGTAVNDALGLSRAEYLLLVNNDETFEPHFMEKAFEIIAEVNKTPIPGLADYGSTRTLGILALWRHTAHGDQKDGIKTATFVETDNAPAVAWLMPKRAMAVAGMFPENGPCFTKGGNGEDTGYVEAMRKAGYVVGSPIPDLATHIDGY